MNIGKRRSRTEEGMIEEGRKRREQKRNWDGKKMKIGRIVEMRDGRGELKKRNG